MKKTFPIFAMLILTSCNVKNTEIFCSMPELIEYTGNRENIAFLRRGDDLVLFTSRPTLLADKDSITLNVVNLKTSYTIDTFFSIRSDFGQSDVWNEGDLRCSLAGNVMANGAGRFLCTYIPTGSTFLFGYDSYRGVTSITRMCKNCSLKDVAVLKGVRGLARKCRM